MATDEHSKRKEIYTFTAPWLAYTLAWNRTGLPGDRFKLAVGSFKEEDSNELKILQLQHSQSLTQPQPQPQPQQPQPTDVAPTSNTSTNTNTNTNTGFAELSRCDHPYPATKVTLLCYDVLCCAMLCRIHFDSSLFIINY